MMAGSLTSSNQRPDTLMQDRSSVSTNTSCDARPDHTFGSAGLIYAVVLRGVPLNVAQALMSGQFVGVIVAASLILREPISLLRWVGIGCISLGILLVGWNA